MKAVEQPPKRVKQTPKGPMRPGNKRIFLLTTHRGMVRICLARIFAFFAAFGERLGVGLVFRFAGRHSCSKMDEGLTSDATRNAMNEKGSKRGNSPI